MGERAKSSADYKNQENHHACAIIKSAMQGQIFTQLLTIIRIMRKPKGQQQTQRAE